jgi:hypothetical protein
LDSAIEWPASATKEENNMGDQDDLPIDREEVQQGSLHEGSQPVNKLDREIEDIRRLMVRLEVERIDKEKLRRGEPSIVARKKKKQQHQQQQSKGARGQLQGKFLDPGGFQNRDRGAHEQELMIFPTVEYDAGASLHPSNTPSFQHINVHSRRGEAPTLSFFFKF